MTPSKYQAAIFDTFASLEAGSNIVISAVAGSGKTTTIVRLLESLTPRERMGTLVASFNTEIKDTLQVRSPKGVDVKTIHGVGFGILKSGNPASRFVIDDRKYRDILSRVLIDVGLKEAYQKSPPFEEEFRRLIDLVRVDLVSIENTLELRRGCGRLISSFSLTALDDLDDPVLVARVVKLVLEHPTRHLSPKGEIKIDFADMLWLPEHLDVAAKSQYDTIFVDEAQDLSRAQLAIILRSRRETSRMVFVGDPRQAIYAFAGANAQSFKEILDLPRTTSLPLSVCYRCGEAIVTYAKRIVPILEAGPSAETGQIRRISQARFLTDVRPQDMVLCRTTSPLVRAFFQIIRQGTPAIVRGRDLHKNLLGVIDAIEKLGGTKLVPTGFRGLLEKWFETMIHRLASNKKEESRLALVTDQFETIEAILDECDVDSADAVRARITSIFGGEETSTTSVILSSIHRAKGLEADRVFLLRKDLLPHPMAKTAVEREQESNLEYVAITRARRVFSEVMHDAGDA